MAQPCRFRPTATAFLTGGFLSLGFEYVLERLEKLRTRRTLERYVSKNLVKEILDNPDSFYSSLRGVRIPVTILFSDIVGFTTLCEQAEPAAIGLAARGNPFGRALEHDELFAENRDDVVLHRPTEELVGLTREILLAGPDSIAGTARVRI